MINNSVRHTVETSKVEYIVKNGARLQVINIDGQDYICLYNIYDKGGVAIIKHGEKHE